MRARTWVGIRTRQREEPGPGARGVAKKDAAGDEPAVSDGKARPADLAIDAPAGARHAQRKAERIAKDPHRVRTLLKEAALKAAASRDKLGDAWGQLQTLFRLLKAWVSGRYREVPWRVIVLALTAVVYFVNPFDLIPDFLGFGLLDDIGVVGFLVSRMGEDLDRFREWEKSGMSDQSDRAAT